MDAENHADLHLFGAVIHGILAVLHGFGVVYNLRRKHWGEAALHGTVMVYDILSFNEHRKEVKNV